MHRKTVVVLLVAALFLACAVSASAQFRIDLDVNMPVGFGYSLSGGSSSFAWNQFFIPFPDARLGWQFGEGLLDGGIGARVFTFIIENILYPEVFLELNLDPITISAAVGGYGFLEFGLLSAALQEIGLNNLSGFHNILIPDLNVAIKVTEWFRIGAGVFMITPFGSDLGGILNNFVYSAYINARFVLLFK